MLKLMKYEFRKMRAALLVMALALACLEIVFFVSDRLKNETLLAICIVLVSLLVFAVYLYILVAGVTSYSRELKDRTGYLAFMTPVRPIAIVLSKLAFTLLAAIAATVLFGAVAYLDYRYLLRDVQMDASLIDQANLMLQILSQDFNLTVGQVGMAAVYSALNVLIGIAMWMCTAFLAVTLSATLLQNRKGFLRGLLSVAMFLALSAGASWVASHLPTVARYPYASYAELSRSLAASLGFNLAVSALFAWLSALLLDRKVSL